MHGKLLIVLICLIVFLVINTRKNITNQSIKENFPRTPQTTKMSSSSAKLSLPSITNKGILVIVVISLIIGIVVIMKKKEIIKFP